METILNLLRTVISFTAATLIIAEFAGLVVLPEAINIMLNMYAGYILAIWVSDWRAWRAEKRKVVA